MTINQPTPRERTVPGIGLDIEDVIDLPIYVGDNATRSLDAEVAVTIHCTAAVAHYVEQLHLPHGFDQFLTPTECSQVAAFIDSLGPSPARDDEFVTERSPLDVHDNPATGWSLENIREAARCAQQHSDDTSLPEYARHCLALLEALVTYLDAFHGTAGLQEILTREERAKVGQYVSQILDQAPTT